MTLAPLPARMFSTDSPKAIKSVTYGYLNGIMYLAPADYAGVGNLCPHASPACRAVCLGLYSGQASMCKSDAPRHRNNVRKSRILKAQWFMGNRAEFMRHVIFDIARNHKRATNAGLELAIRLNGSSDIAFEGIAIRLTNEDCARIEKLSGLIVSPGYFKNVFGVFPGIQFLDYTKNPARFKRQLPENYHLTFSRSETNEATARGLSAIGHNVAVVFAKVPKFWGNKSVINGDIHDLRFLDPCGVIVGLSPKGSKARKDQSGFVVRNSI